MTETSNGRVWSKRLTSGGMHLCAVERVDGDDEQCCTSAEMTFTLKEVEELEIIFRHFREEAAAQPAKVKR